MEKKLRFLVNFEINEENYMKKKPVTKIKFNSSNNAEKEEMGYRKEIIYKWY